MLILPLIARTLFLLSLSTAFGLYRDGTELRALYPGKPEIARQACASQGLKCNYPVLIGNDPYYGGQSMLFQASISPSK